MRVRGMLDLPALERAVEGLKLIENREVFGKVIITP